MVCSFSAYAGLLSSLKIPLLRGRAVKFFKNSPLERGQGVCPSQFQTHPFIPSQEAGLLSSHNFQKFFDIARKKD